MVNQYWSIFSRSGIMLLIEMYSSRMNMDGTIGMGITRRVLLKDREYIIFEGLTREFCLSITAEEQFRYPAKFPIIRRCEV